MWLAIMQNIVITMQYLRAQGLLPRTTLEDQVGAVFNFDAIIQKDCNGIVQQWDAGAENLFGYTAEEMVGRSILCLFPPDRVNEEVALMQLIQEGQELSYIETSRCHKNGEKMHVALRLSGIWDADKKLTGIRSAVHRIDPRVHNAQHVQDLPAQEQYLQRITNNADAAIFSVDEKGVVYSWNPAAESLLGYQAAEIIGNSVQCLHPLEEQHDWHALMSRMHLKKSVQTLETQRLQKDGTLVHVTATLTPIVNEKQDLIGVNTMMRSINKKIRARITELALKRQSKYFEAIVNGSNDAIISNDLQGIVQSWNASAERLFGYSAEEMIGQSILLIMSPEREIEEQRQLDQLFSGSPVMQFSTTRKRKDGTELCVSVSMSSLTDDTNTVIGVSTIARDISDRMEAEQTIWQHANFDPLTKLPNHRLLADRASQVLHECTRRQEKAALVYINLDHLKEINEEFGHAAGDALLVEVAKRISASIRMQDTAARISGDDFVLLINGFTDITTIDNVVERIQRVLDEPVHVASRDMTVTFSAGVSLYPDDALLWGDLMNHADSALYAAKKDGRNRMRYFTQDLKEKATRRRFILNAFRNALEKDELCMHYQPVVSMLDGSLIKAEALIRWTHASGPIAPMEFIPLIEQSDLIHKFGDFVVQQVASEAPALRKKFGSDFGVTFNLSPAQLKGSKSLVENWHSLMGPASFEDAGLIAEITEGTMVDDDEFTQHNLLSLHSAGIGVAIDDFGTGYSSLNYLTKINAQVIKIDRSFTSNLVLNPKTDILCEAIIVMAHKMGMTVVAEGVETKAQWDKLLEIGCDMAQGYFIAKAMPINALLTTWINPVARHMVTA